MRGKYCLFNLEIVKKPKKLNNNVEILFKQDNVAPHPHTTLSCFLCYVFYYF